jgi:hypothetical protein
VSGIHVMLEWQQQAKGVGTGSGVRAAAAWGWCERNECYVRMVAAGQRYREWKWCEGGRGSGVV